MKEGQTPFFPDLRVRTEYEQGIVKCGVDSVIALEELIQESTDGGIKKIYSVMKNDKPDRRRKNCRA